MTSPAVVPEDPTPPLAKTRLSVLRHREFALLFAGQGASVLGDRIVSVAMPFAVLSLPGGSAGDVGLVLGANVLAFGIFVLIGGVVADRVPRQRTMLASDAARALIQGFTAYLLIAGEATVGLLVVTQFLYGAAEAFFRPAALGLVPQVVDPGEEQSANALLTMSMNVSMVLGPVLAGVLVAVVGPGATLAFDAGTFVVSGLTLMFLRPRPVAPSQGASLREEFVGGFREVAQRQWLMATLVLFSFYHALVIPAIYVLGPDYANRARGGAGAWGIIATGFGLGAVLGGVVALRWRPRKIGVVIAGSITIAASQAVIVTAALPTLAVAGLEALTGICVAVGFTVWDTALQTHIPAQAQSRVSSFDHLVSVAMMPIGYVVIGPLAVTIGVHTTSFLATVLTLAVGLAVLALPAQRRLIAVGASRQTEPMPDEPS